MFSYSLNGWTFFFLDNAVNIMQTEVSPKGRGELRKLSHKAGTWERL